VELTTLERVKVLAGIPSTKTSHDAILAQLLTEVSKVAERYMDRGAETVLRTEYHDIEMDGSDHVLRLQGYPVTSVTSVKHDHRGEWSGSEITLDQYDQWSLSRNGTGGMLIVKSSLAANPNALQVVYTGGMGTDSEDFANNYPDVAGAVDQQVVYQFQNRASRGLSSKSGSAGSKTYRDDAIPTDLIPSVVRTLQRYRRPGG